MILNGFAIKSRELLKENFLPFHKLWENVKSGLYQECIAAFFGTDPLSPDILSAAQWLFQGTKSAPPEEGSLEKYRKFMEDNRLQAQSLERAAKNPQQKGVLYLCVLMHIQAGQNAMAPETAAYIHTLLDERETVIMETDSPKAPGFWRQQAFIIKGEAYHLDRDGQIVSLGSGSLFPLAEGLKGLRSFAYTEMLGLMAVDADGQVLARGGQIFARIPSAPEIVSVSAYLSNYMLLDEKGDIHTNIRMDLSGWTDLRYIYVGLNSAAGVKKWSGGLLTLGIGKTPAFSNVAKINTCHGQGRHYIALFMNGEAKDDQGETYQGVTAVAVDEEGYYYATAGGDVYKRPYGEKSSLCQKAGTQVRELLAEKGKVFVLSGND